MAAKNCSNDVSTVEKCSRHEKITENLVGPGVGGGPTLGTDTIVLIGIDFAMGYLNDIIIFSKTEEEHLEHLRIIFERLRQAGLKLKMSKCDFFKKHIQYLGHLISDEGIHPLPRSSRAFGRCLAQLTPRK